LSNALLIVHIRAAAMPVSVACPSCGVKYRLDEKYAGRTFSCKKCGAAVQASAAAERSTAAATMRVECESCGKAYTVAAEHAGKKLACTQCGVKFRIPGGESAVGASTPAQRSAKSASVPPPAAPAGLDVYGLEDEPASAAAPGSRSSPAGGSVVSDSATAAPESQLPGRDHYKPLSEAKKKKVAKRADKLNLMKPSNAGVGISFGAVLAFCLVGWRMYRIMHRFERAAARAQADQSAPEHIQIDFKTFVAENDKETERAIASPETAEARDWLDPTKNPKHSVMEMSLENARAMVAGFYERGAAGVYVLEPTKIGDAVTASEFAVKLPPEPEQRQKCLAWAAPYQGREQPAKDYGQKYIIISAD
jgi:RNase P subunit RPR2